MDEDSFAENVGRSDLRPRTDGGPKFVEVKTDKRFIISIRS